MDAATPGEKNMIAETLRHYWLKGRLNDEYFAKEMVKLHGTICLENTIHRYTRWGRVKLIEYVDPLGIYTWAVLVRDRIMYEGHK